MDNNSNVLTKKYWLRFVLTSLTNAAIFVAYRLYINHINNKNSKEPKILLMKNEDEKKISSQSQENKNKKELAKKQIKDNLVNANNEEIIKIPRRIGRPRKEEKPIAKHLQKK